MRKSVILILYGVVLYFVLKRYYANGNAGLPDPKTLNAPTYLYGILLLSADFTGGLSMVLAAGLTVAFIWQTQNKQGTSQSSKSNFFSNPTQQVKTATATAGQPSFWNNPSQQVKTATGSQS